MSLGKSPDFLSSLSIRLTAWFLIVFGLGLAGILVAIYILLDGFVMSGPERAIRYELEEARTVYQEQGKAGIGQHIISEAEEYGTGRVFYRLYDRSKRILFATELSNWTGLADKPVNATKEGVTLFLGTPQRPTRLIALPIDDELIIESGIDVSREYELLRNYRLGLPFVGCIVLGLAGITGYFAVFRTVRRIDRLTELTRDISGNKLAVRVPVENPKDELGRLAITLNQMLERIESLLTSIKQVSEDVAHELRSPISKIRARAELALSETDLDHGQIGLAENTIEECDGLLNLINSILDISEADANVLQLNLQNVDIAELITVAIDFFEPLAEQKEISIYFQYREPIVVHGDLSKLQRAISNILDNAVKYSKRGGRIEVSVENTGLGLVTIKISDDGIGISRSELPRLFERFYRVDSSRSMPGNGLGLTMSQALVVAHKGHISVQSQVGKGTTVVISIPKEPA